MEHWKAFDVHEPRKMHFCFLCSTLFLTTKTKRSRCGWFDRGLNNLKYVRHGIKTNARAVFWHHDPLETVAIYLACLLTALCIKASCTWRAYLRNTQSITSNESQTQHAKIDTPNTTSTDSPHTSRTQHNGTPTSCSTMRQNRSYWRRSHRESEAGI
jgi:hypothetical protein